MRLIILTAIVKIEDEILRAPVHIDADKIVAVHEQLGPDGKMSTVVIAPNVQMIVEQDLPTALKLWKGRTRK